MRLVVDKWWREFHGHDLVSVPGIVAALRLSELETPDEGRYLNLYFLDGDPLKIMFPMVATVDEFVRARGIVEREKAYLKRHGYRLPLRQHPVEVLRQRHVVEQAGSGVGADALLFTRR